MTSCALALVYLSLFKVDYLQVVDIAIGFIGRLTHKPVKNQTKPKKDNSNKHVNKTIKKQVKK
jgi:hypothetical protein